MQNILPNTEKTVRSSRSRLADHARLAICLLGLCALGWSAEPLQSAVRPAAASAVEAELDGAGWEARRLLGQMLWLKTHAVLHAGVEEREALPGEELSRSGEVHRHENSGQAAGGAGAQSNAGEHAGHGHEGHDDHAGHDQGTASQDEHADHGHQGAYVLVIPPAKEDFRGPIGDLERNVKPYLSRDGTLYSKDSDQTLAFYRLITWLDPHHVQAFVVGASFMSRGGKYADDGLRFLHEGERFNPDSFEIQTELGHFYLVYKRDYPAAAEHLVRALQLIPRHRARLPVEEDLRADAYRWLALTYQEWKQPEKAVAVARSGMMALGYDGTLAHVIERKGYPKE